VYCLRLKASTLSRDRPIFLPSSWHFSQRLVGPGTAATDSLATKVVDGRQKLTTDTGTEGAEPSRHGKLSNVGNARVLVQLTLEPGQTLVGRLKTGPDEPEMHFSGWQGLLSVLEVLRSQAPGDKPPGDKSARS
jgi:hypothetical protein